MKSDEFADYILQHMDAETALRMLLKSQVTQYGKLKLGAPLDPAPGESISPIHIMLYAAMDMGWQMAIDSKEEHVSGLVVGTTEYMEKIFPKKDKDGA